MSFEYHSNDKGDLNTTSFSLSFLCFLLASYADDLKTSTSDARQISEGQDLNKDKELEMHIYFQILIQTQK